MFSTQSYYDLTSKMKLMVDISLDLPQNSLKREKFTKWSQSLNTEDEAEDTNIF